MPHENLYIHQLLINYMNQRLYQVPSNGICLGIASMGIQALLLDDHELQKFCERLSNIVSQLSVHKFEHLHLVVFNPAEQKDIDIFFEGVLLYQMAYKYNKILTTEPNVNLTITNYRSLVFKLVKPKNLDNKGMFTLLTILGCYSYPEIEKFLNILKTTITKILSEDSVGLMLYIHNHIIALGYHCINNTWTIIDANMLYILDHAYSCHDTAKLLIQAFAMVKTSIIDEIKITFSTELILAISNHLDGVKLSAEIQDKFILELSDNDEWKKIHQVTADKLGSTNDGGSWLFMAAKDGKLEVVNQLIQAKADVNLQKDHNGTTPLWAAIQGNHLGVVIALLDAHANANISNQLTGTTPLIIAAQNNYTDILDVLLEAEAYVDHQNHIGITALLVAVQNNHLESTKLLIKAEANVNLTANNNITPLRMAIEKNNYKIVEELMKARAKLDNRILESTDTVGFSKEENIGDDFSMYDSRDFEGFCANKPIDFRGSKAVLRCLC